MNDPGYLLQALLWVSLCTAAAIVGRGYARAAALLLLAQLVIDYAGWATLPPNTSRPVSAVTSVALVFFFAWSTLMTRATWAAAAAGAQFMSFATHVVQPLMPHVGKWAFVTAREIFGYVVLVAMLAGALVSRRRPA